MVQDKRKAGMTTIITLSMILGVAFGLITGKNFPFIEMLGQLFLRLIQMSIILLVTGQIVEAIGGIKPSETGKIGAKTVAIFAVSTFLAAFFGILMAVVFKPGIGVEISSIEASVDVTAGKASAIADTMLGFFPTNIMQAMANGIIVQVIVFAIFVGLGLSYINRDVPSLLYKTLVDFNKIIMRIIQMVMYFAPVGVFALVASSIGKFGIEVIIPLAKYLEIISKGILSQSAKPEHSTSELKKRKIVFGFLFVTDQQTATFG
jgi:Na+/H+-dicarboxylate symporters